MIKKKSLWFLTLFSLILVLSVYYVTMPNELLLTNNNQQNKDTSKDDDKDVSLEENSVLTALRVEADDQMVNQMNELQAKLTDLEVSVEEKNAAFEQLKALNLLKGKEESLEEKVKTEFKVNSFIKIDNDQIRVVIGSNEHSAKLANDIMRSIQGNFDSKMYISVKFQG